MDEQVSNRLVEQRVRNRIMETIETLAEGDAGARSVGFTNYFEPFYDWVPHRGDDRTWEPLSTMTTAENEALANVSSILDDACDSTPNMMTDDEFIETGWPGKIRPIAIRALELMRGRGRFSEEREQDDPSTGDR
jgi:hypothetical protein